MMTFDVEQMLATLTLAQKASLLSGDGEYWTQEIPEAGLPAIEVGDGPHGLRKETGVDMVWVPATCFPTASALGASWDRGLLRRVGAAIGDEARAEGVQVVLGPGVNMKRSPLCGRNFEYLAEDPVLAGELGAAYVEGVQSRGVGTSLKHFAANNQETERTRVSVEADERTLREIYLAAFERVVERADPWTVMCAYNRLHGTHASENAWLLTRVLRDDWGYTGVVLSDWDAVHRRVPALVAGLDLEMPGTDGRTDAEIVAAVEAGALDMSVVDRAVRRVLTLVDRTYPAETTRTGAIIDLGTAPGVPLTPEQLDLLGARAHHELAREAAAACVTLLRNEDDVLPLAEGGEGVFAVVGAFASVPRIQGAGSAGVQPTRVDVPLEEIRTVVGCDRVVFAQGFASRAKNPYLDEPAATAPEEVLRLAAQSTRLADEAVAVAAEADIVLAFVGLPMSSEEEAADRTTLALPEEQVVLLERLCGLGRPVVVVLTNGSAVTMAPWHDRVAAVVEGWLPGQAGAGALVDVLFGRADPGGRTAETFPHALEDTPAFLTFPGERGAVRYGEGVFVGYRWYDALRRDVLYPFGHGLSYTTFVYSDLEVAVEDASAGRVRVSVTVTNTGSRAGSEVVQVYVGDIEAAVRRPDRELKGFEKVHLEAGAQTRVAVVLTSRDFAWFDVVPGAWRREAGRFRIEVGSSSRDVRAAAEVVLDDDPDVPPLVPDAALLDAVHRGGNDDAAGSGSDQSRFVLGHRA